MSFSALATVIAQLLGLVAVGVVLRTTGLLKREQAKALNAVIVYAALPALIFRVVYTAPLSWDLVRVAGIALATSVACLGVAWGLTRALRLPRATAGGFMIVAAIGNTGYLGYPVVTMLLGDIALSRAVFYDVFGTVVMLFTAGIGIAARFGDHEEGPVSMMRELFTFPAMVALLLGLAARLVPWPQVVETPVRDWLVLAGNMAVPLIMVSLGLSLSAEGFRSAPKALVASAGVKLLLSPAIALGLALLLGEHGSLRLVVLQASMPAAMLPLVIGERFNLDTEFIASAILTATVACVVTVPLVQLLLR